MQNKIQITKKETNIWDNLPDTITLSDYFKQTDLIELSKVCKKYRGQLKSQVLRTLKVHYINDEYPKIDIGKFNSEKKLDVIIDCLRRDFSGCYHLVNEVIFNEGFSNQFLSDFFTLFPKISQVTIVSVYAFDLSNLINIFSDSIYLRSIALKADFYIDNLSKNNCYYNFFHRINSIYLYIPTRFFNLTLPFDIIDSSFSNLKNLTIINNSMLSKLSGGLSSLRFVEFFINYDFEKSQISIFISNNPQLMKLSISVDQIDSGVINSIMSLERLEQLEITEAGDILSSELSINTNNYSIKHFRYNGYCYNQFHVGILKACKCLDVLELRSVSITSYLGSMINDIFPEINTLLISRRFNPKKLITLLLEIRKFNQVKFRNGIKASAFISYQYQWSVCWEPKYDYSDDTDEFTLVRK